MTSSGTPLRVILITVNASFAERLQAGLTSDTVVLEIAPVPTEKTLLANLVASGNAALVAVDADLVERHVVIPAAPTGVEGHVADILLLFDKIGPSAVELCLSSHAHGCLDYGASADTFARAADAMVNGGELWFPRWMMEPFYEMALTTNSIDSVEGRSTAQGRAHETAHLTEREAETLSLAQLGLTNKEIGARLNISPHTAKKHLHSALIKHGMRRRRQLYG